MKSNRLKPLKTKGLTLMAVNQEVTGDLLDGTNEALDHLGIGRFPGWPTPDTFDILPHVHASLLISTRPTGFEFWMIVENESGLVIGDIGFHGFPNGFGEVEIGFGLVPEKWGLGYASEALGALIQWLARETDVRLLKASCLLGNRGSERVLLKAGFCEWDRSEEQIFFRLAMENARTLETPRSPGN